MARPAPSSYCSCRRGIRSKRLRQGDSQTQSRTAPRAPIRRCSMNPMGTGRHSLRLMWGSRCLQHPYTPPRAPLHQCSMNPMDKGTQHRSHSLTCNMTRQLELYTESLAIHQCSMNPMGKGHRLLRKMQGSMYLQHLCTPPRAPIHQYSMNPVDKDSHWSRYIEGNMCLLHQCTRPRATIRQYSMIRKDTQRQCKKTLQDMCCHRMVR